MIEGILWLEEWLEGEGLNDKTAKLIDALLPLAPLQTSGKHMSGRQLGRLEPTKSLKYHAQKFQLYVN
jgi:hypothetical protein